MSLPSASARAVLVARLLVGLTAAAGCGRHEIDLLRHQERDSGPLPDGDVDGYPPQVLPDASGPLPALYCIERINELRALVGLSPYQRQSVEEVCVFTQVKTDAQIGQQFYSYGSCGETMAAECPHYYGGPTDVLALCLQQMWETGPGAPEHDALAGNHAAVECGTYQTGDGHTWVLIDFFGP